LPAGFSRVVLAPEQRHWQLPAGAGVVRVNVSTERQQGDESARLIITHEVDLNPFMVQPDDYAELVEIEKQLTHAKARTVLVTREP